MSPTQMALRADTDMQSMVIDAYYLRNWNMYLRMVKYLRWSASVYSVYLLQSTESRHM